MYFKDERRIEGAWVKIGEAVRGGEGRREEELLRVCTGNDRKKDGRHHLQWVCVWLRVRIESNSYLIM